MDDQRTRDELDALADLFLTGTLPSGNGGSAARSADQSGGGGAKSAVLDELDGPAPLRLPQSQPANLSPSDGDEGETRGRFDRPSRVRMARRAGGASVGRAEAVFLGNLPGFAGPWLSQYAHDLAQRHGPVGLLHIAGDRAEIEVLTGPPESSPEQDANQEVDANDSAFGRFEWSDAGLADRAQALIEHHATPVRRWLVHLPTEPSGRSLDAALQMTHWTFVFGADDMAVASAAGAIERLLQADAGGPARRIGAVVMGSDAESSRAAVDRLNNLLDDALGVTVELIDWRQRMRPVHVQRLGGGPFDDGAWSQLRDLFDAFEEPGDAGRTPPAHMARAVEPTRAIEEANDTDAEYDSPHHTTPDAPTMPTATAMPEPTVDESRDAHDALDMPERDDRPSEPAPASSPSRAAAPARSTDHESPDLVAFLSDSGVGGAVRLEARCPDHESAQIVLDETGRLHLLVQHVGHGRADAGASLRAAMLDLLETRAWVARHMQLLQLTQRQCRFDIGATPMLHIFTDQAKPAAAMIARVDDDVKLHLLQRVNVGGASGWVSVELN